ncbi:MAG: hypothetical protein EXR77_19035 [Myxococcales bacterium]|nr:hypothetical protein [Myxococcales bacterium]
MPSTAFLLRGFAAALVITAMLSCTSAAKRRFFATCDIGTDCESGLCSQGVCSKSCATSGECGAGVCVEKVCKPIDRVGCQTTADCDKLAPPNGCRATLCTNGQCAFVSPAVSIVCGTKCEAGTWVPGQCTDGQCVVAKNPIPVACGDNNVCTDDNCAPTAGCTYATNSQGCDDGDACTVNDLCTQGKCAPGGLKTCNDSNSCTADVCDKAAGCTFTPAAGPCDDGDACTVDQCSAGKCVIGGPKACADNNACTADACDKALGCTFTPAAGACDDGDPCSVGDACGGGTCKGAAKPCDDVNACTIDTCVAGSGCLHGIISAPCNDGDACSISDVCTNGVCVGTLDPCDDKLACTVDSCATALGGCQHQSDNAKCDETNLCSIDYCDALKGCLYSNAVEGTACSKGDLCVEKSSCIAGLCTTVQTKVCNDNNPCTADKCDPVKGCMAEPLLTGACDDGDQCTTPDLCGGGNCAGQSGVICDDFNACTTDNCDKVKGCMAEPLLTGACDDGDACSTGDNCSTGKCLGIKTLWKAKPDVGAPYTAEGVAVQGLEVALVGWEVANADYVKRRITVTDTVGTTKWQAIVNANGIDRPVGVVGSNGVWYVAGETKSSATAEPTAYVKAFEAGGKSGFSKTLTSLLGATSLRGIAVSGTTLTAVGVAGLGKNAKTLLGRYTVFGSDLGNQEYDGGEVNAVVGYPNTKGFALVGSLTEKGSTKALVARVTETGQLSWQVGLTEATANFAEFHGVALLGDDVVAVGEVLFGTIPQIYVARVSADGKEMWRKALAPLSASHGSGIAVYGNWLAVSIWGELVGQDAGIVLFDAFGNAHNTATVAAAGDQVLTSIAGVGDGTFVVHGTDTGQPVNIVLARTNAYYNGECNFGQCAQIKGYLCDDGNPCTQDSCTPSSGCEFKAFQDTTSCAIAKTCQTGACLP